MVLLRSRTVVLGIHKENVAKQSGLSVIYQAPLKIPPHVKMQKQKKIFYRFDVVCNI